jgi:hypothetical protein
VSAPNTSADPIALQASNASLAKVQTPNLQALKAKTPAPSLTKAQKAKKRAVRLRAYYRTCKKSGKFNERQARFSKRVVLAGRCVTSRVKGIKTIGTRGGHHPSASRALDIMVNTHGSCRAGRKAGNKIAKYLMNNKGKHGVYYIIWRNGYWNARDKARPISNFRKMGRGGCTAGHYDHVHVSFK